MERNHAWDDSLVLVTADHGHYLVLSRPEMLAQARANDDAP
jgi:alkaline phosphatase